MKREYWNNLACRYEDEIFSVLHNDRKGLVLEQVRKFATPDKTASDYGCGIGYFLPCLSANFKKVFAIDISRALIAKARETYPHLSNIEYITADLAADGLQLTETHFILSVNTLIMPSLSTRLRILDCLACHLLKNGHLVLVVPSLESVLLTDFRLIQMNLRDGLSPSSAVRSGFEKNGHYHLRQGIVPIDDVPTKHYLKEELVALLERRNLHIDGISKIEYHWNTEFDSPPRWMKSPFPWDWLIVAQKTG
jgi:SAM-dependent methyltransferase